MNDESVAPVPPRRPYALTAAVVVACFLIFGAIVGLAYLKNRDTGLVPDLTKVDEADRWRYAPDTRAARLTELRGKEQTAANSYGWLDQKAGVVRLPIERAMDLVVQEQEAKH